MGIILKSVKVVCCVMADELFDAAEQKYPTYSMMEK